MSASLGAMISVFMSGSKGVGVSSGIGGSVGLFYTVNGGATWIASDIPTAVSTLSLSNMYVSIDGNNAIALVENNSLPSPTVYYSTNGGATWLGSTYLGNPLNIFGQGPAMSISGTHAIIATQYGQGGVNVFYSSNGGATWSACTGTGIQTSEPYNGMKVIASGKAIATTRYDVFYSTNFGASWNISAYLPAADIGSSSMNSSGKCIISSYGGGISYSSDGGATFALGQYNGSNFSFQSIYPNRIMINDNDNCIYVDNSGLLYYSSDAGATWFLSTTPSLTPLTPLSGCNALFINTTGTAVSDKAIACTQDSSYYSTDAGHTWTASTTTISGGTTNTGAISLVGENGIVSTVSAFFYTNDGGINWASAQEGSPVICFKEGSKILTDTGYKLIQDLRHGDLVKTVSSGLKKIEHIGNSKMYNNSNDIRSTDKLYKCCRSEYPELSEDLVITGGHSILVNNFKDHEQMEKTQEVLGKIYVTDGHYRLPACVDDRTKIFEENGVHTIWHLSLENSNYYMNYGIYANGLLVETTSNRMMVELSGMTLL